MYPFNGVRRQSKPSRPQKLTFSLRDEKFHEKHVGGVNSLVVDGDCIWTGGRDGTVRKWASNAEHGTNNSGTNQQCFGTTEAHAGWVNSLIKLGSENIFVSGGTDRAVNCWRQQCDGSSSTLQGVSDNSLRCINTLERHSDYVTQVVSPSGDSKSAEKFVSAGLGVDQVFLWDVNRAFEGKSNSSPLTQLKGQTNSVYSTDVCAECTTIVTGDNKGVVRRWDTRTPHDTPTVFTGHSGTVRTLCVDPTGRLCLTGSSDGTMRLWDLGQGKCVQTLTGVHNSSVWSAVPDKNWRSVVSGGADGSVYVTDLVHRRSQLVFREEVGIVDLKYAGGNGESFGGSSEGNRINVWTATSGSNVSQWSKRLADEDEYVTSPGSSLNKRAARLSIGSASKIRSQNSQHSAQSGWFVLGMSPGLSPGQSSFNSTGQRSGSGMDGNKAIRVAHIQGTAPVVEHAQLPNRRHVLTRDGDGGMALWDVTRFQVTKRWEAPGGLNGEHTPVNSTSPGSTEPDQSRFEATLASLKATPTSVPSWFTVDSRKGYLSLTLTPSSVFQAEAYASEYSDSANSEQKINLGVQVIHAMFRVWARRRKDAVRKAGDIGEDVEGVGNDLSKDFDINSLHICDDARVFATPSRVPIFSFEQPEPPYDPTSSHNNSTNQSALCYAFLDGEQMQGTEAEETSLPDWIVATVDERYKVPDPPKIGFYVSEVVEETNDSYLATGKSFSSGKVSAPRVLTIKKVAAYVVAKLQVTLRDDTEPEHVVSIFCNGKALDPSWSLATVKEHVWRKSDDLQLNFQVTEAVAKRARDELASG